MTSRFTHTPIEPQGYIRLVRIGTEKRNGLICCEISDHRLQEGDEPAYRALSYTWGTSSDRTDILLNGQLFGVSPTLHDFLVMYAEKSRDDISLNEEHFHEPMGKLVTPTEKEAPDKELRLSEYFWIDQLCIDQGNDREKSHQVAMMAKIYRSAANVAVWLDLRYSSSAIVIEALEKNVFQDPDSNELKFFEDLICEWESSSTSNDALPLEFAAATALFEHPYWTRLWVIQEFMLASSKTFYFGSHELGHGILQRCDNILKELRIDHNDIDTTQAYDLLWGLRGDRIPPDPVAFFFRLSMRSECSDPRDKVFGVLALAETSISVDYTKSVEEVFWDAVSEFEKGPLDLTATRFDAMSIDDRRMMYQVQVREVLRLARKMMPPRSGLSDVDVDRHDHIHALHLGATYFNPTDWPMNGSSKADVHLEWRRALRKVISGEALVTLNRQTGHLELVQQDQSKLLLERTNE